MRPGLVAALALAACGAKQTATPNRDAGDAGAGGGTGAATGAGSAAIVARGRISVTVLWPTAPAAMRTSPGYTPCHTPRPARAQIGTLHGVAGAFVVVTDVASDAAARNAPAPAAGTADVRRLTVRDCAIEPAASTTGSALEIQTQDAAHAIVVERVGKPWLEDDVTLAPVELARARLPVLGHTVRVAVGEPGAIRVIADGAADDAAWVLAAPHAHAGVTDEVGALGLADVPAGAHTVVAWLPPRAGHPARRASGAVTVVADEVAELKLTFTP